MRARFVVIATLIILAMPAKLCAEEGSQYLILRGGIFDPVEVGNNGSMAEFVAGHQWTKYFASELGYMYYQACSNPEPWVDSFNTWCTELKANSVFVTAMGIIPVVEDKLHIDFGAGLGYYRISSATLYGAYPPYYGTSYVSENPRRVGPHVVVDIEYLMFRRISLLLGAKFFALPTLSPLGGDSLDYGGKTYSLGLKYRF